MEQKARKVSHKGARKKGSRAEYLVRDELVKIGINAKRVPMSGALSYMKGDVMELNVVNKHVHEVKNHEALDLGSWWRQASVQALNEELPVLTFMSNRQKPYTVLRTCDFDLMAFNYEETGKLLTLNLIPTPTRFNFWSLLKKTGTLGYDVYLWDLAGKTTNTVGADGRAKQVVYPDEELVIVPFDFYLILRKRDVRFV